MAKCSYHEKCDGHGIGGFEPTRTKQAFKEECDINEILKRARNGQDISGQLNARIASYGDVSSIPDYHQCMNAVVVAEQMFMALDADIRERFKNDPGEFLAFVQDDKNYDEAVKLGLVKKKDVPVSVPAAPATAPAPAPVNGDGSVKPS